MVPRSPLPAILLLLALAAPVAGQGVGGLAYQRDVRVVKTEWFDIIYPAASAPAAVLLRDNADALYVRAAGQFGGAPEFRMPLVITPATDVLNGYFNPVPYNHIVIYDALPDYGLAHNEVTLLSVVYHELIHAVTMSKKSPIMKGVAKIFGDGYTWTELNMTPSTYEGTAVAMESLEDGFDDGGGRLNSDFALHIMRQAKIEGKFPAWDDTTGFRDTAPTNLPYIMGGAFTDYLITTYGLPLFQDFWNRSVFFGKGFSTAAFKSVYSVPIRDAWENFIAAIEIPATTANPSVNTLTGSGAYAQVVSSPKGAAWLDTFGGTVWHIPAGSPPASVKPRKLLSRSGLRSISYSLDGRYLGLTRITQRGFPRNEALVFDTESRRLLKVGDAGLRDTAVVTLSDGAPYAVAVKSQSQTASLVYYPLDAAALRRGTTAYSYGFPLGTIPFNPLDMGGGRTAFICKNGIRWSIGVLDAVSGEMLFFDAPDPEMELRYLNVSVRDGGAVLHFSWTEPGSLPRPGSLEFTATAAEAQWRLVDADISGGVYSPAPLSEGTILSGAKFFTGDAVRVIDTAPLPSRTLAVLPRPELAGQSEKPRQAAIPDSKRYVPFRYWTRPLVLPAAVIPVRKSNFQADSNAIPLGVSFAFDDPGDSLIFIAAGAADPFTHEYYAAGTVYGGNDSLLVDADYTFTYGQDVFTRSVARLALSSLVNLGGNVNAVFANTAWWSRVDGLTGGGGYNRVLDTAQISFSNLRRYGKSHYASGGATLAPFYQIYYADAPSLYQNAGLDAAVSLPQILPFRNPDGFTFNLPVTLGASLFPGPEVLMQYYLSTVLFAAEIQRAIPAVPLFFRRFAIQGQYIHTDYRSNSTFDILRTLSILSRANSSDVTAADTAVLAFIPEIGINAGALVNVGFRVSMELRVDLNAEQFAPTFGVNVSLRY